MLFQFRSFQCLEAGLSEPCDDNAMSVLFVLLQLALAQWQSMTAREFLFLLEVLVAVALLRLDSSSQWAVELSEQLHNVSKQ